MIGAATQTYGTHLSLTALFVIIPNVNKPSKGPYVYAAIFNNKPIMLGSFTHLKTIQKQGIWQQKLNVLFVLFFCAASSKSALR